MNKAHGYRANPKDSLETELQGGAASAVPFRDLIQFGLQPLGALWFGNSCDGKMAMKK